MRSDLIAYYEGSVNMRFAPVSVYRAGVRGACHVPRGSEGPQNLFEVHRSAKPTANLRHLVVKGGPQSNYAPCLILTKLTDLPYDFEDIISKHIVYICCWINPLHSKR
ncbi:hypothetical protein AVEN_45330-1 [Araneus ventricosus]|uniref:Uncharacterized protein n=1 Tax=Araneus ventricosus TaxID=182803 RepID=A0A4Y2IDD7_ARAVE|nr:hypothetical protein AVEN_45330-1 [Araneus ventricosus]